MSTFTGASARRLVKKGDFIDFRPKVWDYMGEKRVTEEWKSQILGDYAAEYENIIFRAKVAQVKLQDDVPLSALGEALRTPAVFHSAAMPGGTPKRLKPDDLIIIESNSALVLSPQVPVPDPRKLKSPAAKKIEDKYFRTLKSDGTLSGDGLIIKRMDILKIWPPPVKRPKSAAKIPGRRKVASETTAAAAEKDDQHPDDGGGGNSSPTLPRKGGRRSRRRRRRGTGRRLRRLQRSRRSRRSRRLQRSRRSRRSRRARRRRSKRYRH